MQDECGVGWLLGLGTYYYESPEGSAAAEVDFFALFWGVERGGAQPTTQPNQRRPFSRDPNAWGVECGSGRWEGSLGPVGDEKQDWGLGTGVGGGPGLLSAFRVGMYNFAWMVS